MLKTDPSNNQGPLAAAQSESTQEMAARRLSMLGVQITDIVRTGALRMLEDLMCAGDGRCRSVFFVNAHTLNLAADKPEFRQVLNSADLVFNDGTGARWAARQRGVALFDNLNGTDLVPNFFSTTRGKGYRYFLLGAAPNTIGAAARASQDMFDGWELAGHHHGYIHDGGGDAVIDKINASRTNLLLVGMGNPIQETWIHDHQHRLKVGLAAGVGGLFDYWSGSLKRAPGWVRKVGCEWVHLMLRQPHKWRRYLLGNPKFIYRMTRMLRDDLRAMRDASRRNEHNRPAGDLS